MGGQGQSDRNSEELKETIGNALFELLPASFQERYAAAVQIRHAFHETLAKMLQDSLNEFLKTASQDTLLDKQSLTTSVNEKLRAVGLAVRCPKTGLPGTLVADFKDAANEDVSRFRIAVRDPRRGHYQSFSSNTLWELTLMEDAPRQESLSRGFKKGGGN